MTTLIPARLKAAVAHGAICATVALGSAAFARAQDVTFTPARETIPFRTTIGAIADVDLDGDADLVGAVFGGEPLVHLNDGAARFTSVFPPPPLAPIYAALNVSYVATVADFTGDGIPDLLSAVGLRFGLGGGAFGSPQPVPLMPSTYLGYSFGVGDVDQDNDQDVLIFLDGGVAHTQTQTTLWLNNGQGVFVDATATSGLALGAVVGALVDLDGDGLPDVLVKTAPQSFPGAVVVQKNLGGGIFAPPISIDQMDPLVDPPPVRACDVDGDGLLDVVSGGETSDRIQWTKQLVPFGFAPQPSMVVGAGFVDLETLDLDGDGQHEILLLYPASIVRVSTGPSGLGTPVELLPQGGTEFRKADFDGDGDEDLTLADARGHRRVVFNDGQGGLVAPFGATPAGATLLTSSATSPFRPVADHDGDGSLDVIAQGLVAGTGAPRFFLTNGRDDGAFSATTELPCNGCAAGAGGAPALILAVFDADADGDPDYLVNSYANSTLVPALLRNDGAAGVTWVSLGIAPPPGFAFGTPTTADFDGDGDVDLFLPLAGPFAYLYSGTGTGAFTLAALLTLTSQIQLPSTGDYDGDGDPDVYGTSPTGQDVLLQNDGAWQFTDIPIPTGPFSNGGVLADVDGDGDGDIVSSHRIRLQTAPKSFAPAVAIPGATPETMGALDFDGDGDVDLFGRTTGAIRLNSGSGSFTLATGSLGTAGSWTGDFDRDGDVDAVSPSFVVSENRIRQLDVTATLRPGGVAGFTVRGAPLAAYVLGFDLASLAFPQSTPFGRLVLDPSSAVVITAGTLDAQGLATIDGVLGAATGNAFLGTSFVFQAVVDHPYGPRLTGSRTLTVSAY